MSLVFEKWTVVQGRRYRPVLRVRDAESGAYLNEEGYLDCFDSPEAADLAVAAATGGEPGQLRREARRVFDGTHVEGTVSADPLAANPFRDKQTLLRVAGECPWDPDRGCFSVGNKELAEFSTLLQISSLAAQRDIANFIETCVYRGRNGLAVRKLRMLTADWLGTCRRGLYAISGHPALAQKLHG